MPEKDNTTHEEKVVNLLQTIACIQGLAMGLALTQAKNVPPENITELGEGLQSLLKDIDFK